MNKAQELLNLIHEAKNVDDMAKGKVKVGDEIADQGLSVKVIRIDGKDYYCDVMSGGPFKNKDKEIKVKKGDKIKWTPNGIEVL